MFKKTVAGATLGATTLLWASPASAQDLDSAPQAVVDNLWLVIAGALVFLMQAGFAFVEAGLTRAKNLANIMAKNLADMAIGVTMFFIVGYTIAYGSGGSDWLGGFGDLFFQESADPEVLFDLSAGLTPATNFFFQVVFAATAVTIASGAMAERTKFTTYLVFAAVMTAIIYPVVVHWTWGGGLIAQMSIGDAVYSDFAGSTIVHLTGGVAALVGAYLIGGVFILWFGWFGFNAGSELAADEFVPFLAMNTLIAAAAGVIGATAIIWLKTGVADVAMAGNGALAGLVSITAPVGTVTPVFALVIGLVGGVIVVFSVLAFDKIKIDDPVGAISVHGTCGIWGTLSIGLFAKYDDAFLGREDAGLIYGGGYDQLAMQFVMVVIVIAWVGITSFILFGALKATLGLRVSEEEEVTGLDVAEHGSSGYGLEAVGGG